jgi:uncharacterized protein YdeI (YjbR/CyaY-like superfamily)
MSEEAIFFKTPDDFRDWLKLNYQSSTVQWVGFYKKSTGLASITWPQSVDQALCYGWIDGLRKSIDSLSYKIRFTPRKANSHWSAINLKRMEELTNLGLVRPAGQAIYQNRIKHRAKLAAHEQTKVKLSTEYLKKFMEEVKAWKDFNTRAPSYQKQCIWWIMSAKKEETREKRLGILIESCEKGAKIPPLRWQK